MDIESTGGTGRDGAGREDGVCKLLFSSAEALAARTRKCQILSNNLNCLHCTDFI